MSEKERYLREKEREIDGRENIEWKKQWEEVKEKSIEEEWKRKNKTEKEGMEEEKEYGCVSS